jgi:two-component system chemotaxis response regulator CheY
MKKILVIEDDASIRELLVEILEDQGYQVSYGTNGLEGIKSLESIIPDLILMDVMMPIMDGYAFRKEILHNPKWNLIPIIAMSAQEQGETKLADYAITNFINKPFELNNLLEKIRTFA